MSENTAGKEAPLPDEIYELIQREHLSYDLQLVYDMAGRDVAIACVKYLPTTRIYTPMIINMKGCMEVIIPKLSETMSVIEIAQLLRITPDLVRRYKKKKKS